MEGRGKHLLQIITANWKGLNIQNRKDKIQGFLLMII